MTELNVPLLRKALEHITAHPDEWKQDEWAKKTACGTACCVAGHVTLMQGHEIDFDRADTYGAMVKYTSTGEYIEDVARRELGLTDIQAEAMFHPSNRLHSLWSMASSFTDGEITVPPEVSA